MVKHEQLQASNGELQLPIPGLYWDMAFIVDQQEPIITDLGKDIQALDFQIYPNPIAPGQYLHVKLEDKIEHISMLDMSGKTILTTTDSQSEVKLPPNLSEGFYWLQVKSKNGVGVKPLLIREK